MQIIISLYESVLRLKPQGSGLSLQIQSINIYLNPENLISQFSLISIEFSVSQKNKKKIGRKKGDKHCSEAENLVDTVPSTIRNSITIFMCGKKLYYSCKDTVM